MADQPRKGLWERVKGVLGVPDEGEDEAPESRPQIVSTFTASRLPPTGGGASIPDTLFPPSQGKWELYEDAWSDLDQRERAEPELPPDEPAPAAPEMPPAESAAAEPAPAEPPAPAELPPSIDEEDDEALSTTLESLTDAESPTDVLSHLDDAEVDALARAVGLEEPSPPEPPDEAPLAAGQEVTAEPPTWRPTPDLDAVAPKGDGALFAEPPHEVRDRLPGAREPAEAPSTSTSDAIERDAEAGVEAGAEAEAEAEAQRRIEVHEQHLEAAAARARAQTAPRVHVHDDRLDRPAPPQQMNPSEAVALAERGRSARGPREDVGPAS